MSEIITIEKGADFEIDFRLTRNGIPEPLGLGGGDEITVLLPAADPSVNSIELLLSEDSVVVESDPRGEFKAVGDETVSALLKAGNNQDIVVKIKRGTEDITKNVRGLLNVEEPALQSP